LQNEAGVELHQEMEGAQAVKAAPVKSGPTEVEEDGLGERLEGAEIVRLVGIEGSGKRDCIGVFGLVREDIARMANGFCFP